MQIVVDKLPKEPKECLFSQEVIHGVVKFYACTLKPDIPGKTRTPCVFVRIL